MAERFERVDLVINNAGVGHSQTVEDATYADFEWSMGINFWGVVHGTKAFLPLLRQRQDTALTNVSSIFGIISLPTQATYNASKFTVPGFTEALRHETAGSGLYVMCVHPGGIKTNIARSARFHVDPDGDENHADAATFFDKLALNYAQSSAGSRNDPPATDNGVMIQAEFCHGDQSSADAAGPIVV